MYNNICKDNSLNKKGNIMDYENEINVLKGKVSSLEAEYDQQISELKAEISELKASHTN